MRHDDDVSLFNFSTFTALDTAAAQLVRGNILCFDGFAARDESRRPLKYVDHVRVLGMDFRLPRLFSAAGVDHVVAAVTSVEQHGSLGERFVYLALSPVLHRRCTRTL